MRIQDIETRLEELKNRAITATGVPQHVADDIALAAPPDPEMGDRGFPCFALARHLRKAPPLIAEEVAQALDEQLTEDDVVHRVSTAGPYVNLRFHPGRLANIVIAQILDEGRRFGTARDAGQTWMVEFSSPNTNKPQHLGHVRNNLIGDSLSRILDAGGKEVVRVNLINDRGIHICKSMLAYEKFGGPESPESTGEKGDHFVGRYYVLFNQKFQEEYLDWQQTLEGEQRFQQWLDSPESKALRESSGEDNEALRSTFFSDYENQYFNRESELGGQARQMLRKWEDGDEEVVELWETMNQWVFDGFDETYERLGVDFDEIYLESETYDLGRRAVQRGLDAGIFFRRDDGAVVCDLEQVELEGEKVLLRSDGTSVYMTQDLGTAIARFDDYAPEKMVYVVGDEQNYHFDVLFRILGLLHPDLQGRLHHLSYGMVELPEGKMKSREGTVVDADDLLDEMESLARRAVDERYDDLDEKEADHRARVIGLAALKFFILDFAPRTTVQFDPQRSIEFQGRTGPYCLYSYARISSIGRRFHGWPELDDDETKQALRSLGTSRELEVLRVLQSWPDTVATAVDQLNPGRVAEYLFELCSAFSSLYNDADHRIVEIEGPRRQGLLLMARAVQQTLAVGLKLLGIPTLEEM